MAQELIEAYMDYKQTIYRGGSGPDERIIDRATVNFKLEPTLIKF